MASHPNGVAVVAQAKADLITLGVDLSGACGAFRITSLAAWRLRAQGAGLLDKPSGNNCQGYAVDVIAYPDGQIYDVLVASGDVNGATWQDDGLVDPARWRPPIDPGSVNPAPPPLPPPDPAPAVDLAPRVDALEAIEAQLIQQIGVLNTQLAQLTARVATLERRRYVGHGAIFGLAFPVTITAVDQ